MDGWLHSEECYSTQFQQRQTISLPGVSGYLDASLGASLDGAQMISPSGRGPGVSGYLKALDGEHVLLCFLSAVAVYVVGYIVAWLFFSGIMLFVSVGLVVFLVMEIADSVDASVGNTY